MAEKFETVDEYIASYPPEVREVLEKVRRTIHAAAPGAGEKISYQIPTITLDGSALIHFSGWKSHIALYPIPPADETLTAALAPYRSGKGTLKFPLDKPIPYDLLTRVTQAFVTARKNQE
ncbi:iron chaperone [Kribbella sp. NPDC004875]|uniref:iron chaperone n=1 Tax=Kribbella sp. NPDC004875 TaxID=3364107 RepID=UPI00367949B6